jgi:putative peptide zinc metalloprotease protein
MKGNLFSESWYRVAELKVGLITSTTFHKQYFRGEEYYVLRDPLNNKFFKVTPESYKFLIRLTPKKTVEQIWDECLNIFPETAPTQDDVIRILSQLHHSNLLFFRNKPNSENIFERHVEKKRKELGSKILGILFYKIPLWDPEAWLKSVSPIIHLIFSKLGMTVWFIVVFIGIKLSMDNFDQLLDGTQGILAPSNIGYIYLAMIVLKLFHEFGHAMMTKRFGGEVHVMGVMFLVFTPLPYMDASSSWAFRQKWHRVLVGAAGMIVEIFLAAIAAIVWASTGEGIIHNVAFNMMMIGSVSSILFNGNPLTRLDSYYILSDMLEIPNLSNRCKEQLIYFVEKYVYRVDELYCPSDSSKEAFWLVTYGSVSMAYRVLISFGIALFVMDQWFEVGLIIVALSVFTWLIKPMYGLYKYLLHDGKLMKTRRLAVSVTGVFIAVIVIVLGFIPIDDSIKASGIVESVDFANVYQQTSGYLETIHVKSGQRVKKDQIVLSFKNVELDYDIASAVAQLKESKALELRARKKNIADLKPIKDRISFLKDKINLLNSKKDRLNVRCEVEGVWVAPDIETLKNTWIKRGEKLGTVLPGVNYRFVAAVRQEKASDLFSRDKFEGEIKLIGNEHTTKQVKSIKVIPYEQNQLPSAALGWFGGGNIAVKRTEDGKTAEESFFEVRADFKDYDKALIHGRVGMLRMQLEPKPIAVQLYRSMKKLLQRRYKV